MARTTPTDVTTRDTAATSTTTRSAGAGPVADATATTNGPAFDAKANDSASINARLEGKPAGGGNVKEFTVNTGQSLWVGPQRFTEGEKVSLGEIDAERLLAKGTVVKGSDAKRVQKDTADTDEVARQQKLDADQRAIDEAAAAKREADNLASGLLSGAENR